MSATATDHSRNAPVGATSVAISPGSRASALPLAGDCRLWLAVAAGFALLAVAWALLFVAAHRAQVQSVPLAGANGGTKP